MEPHEKVYRSKKEIILHNFLGGIAWGLGVTIGLSVVLAILGFIFSKVDFIPVIGGFITQIVNYVATSGNHLR